VGAFHSLRVTQPKAELLLSPVTSSETPRFAWRFGEITGEFFSAHSPHAGHTLSEENALCSRLMTPRESAARSGLFAGRIQGNQQGEKTLFRNLKSLIQQSISPCKIFAQTSLAQLRSSGGLKAAPSGRARGNGQGAKALFRGPKSLNPQTILE
jgi:hypothetical protein